MHSKFGAYVYLSLAMVIVGSSVVFAKIITHVFPVFLASGLRFAIACLILFPILHFRGEKLCRLPGKEMRTLVVMAFCGQFVFTLFVLLGLRYTSAIEAAIITSTSPVVMVMAAFLLFREKPGPIKLIAAVLVVAGVIIVNGLEFKGMAWSNSHAFGNLLMTGAVLGEAFFLLLRKQISAEVPDLIVTACLCLLGFVMFLPLAVYQGLNFDFNQVPVNAWISMVYFGAVFTVLAYLFWFKGVSKVSGSTAGIFTAVMPVSAIALSCVFLNEHLSVSHALGGGLILSAILLTSCA